MRERSNRHGRWRGVNKFKVKKHFDLTIDDGRFAFTRKSEQIAAEAALDGIYILRTTVDSQAFSTSDVVRSYKQLARVERAFRALESIDLEIRPIYHYREDRVRAHVLLAMLAYYVEWHLREAWAELLFIDEQTPIGIDPVTKAQRSEQQGPIEAHRKRRGCPFIQHPHARTRLTSPQHTTNQHTEATFMELTKATPIQQRALALVSELPLAL